MRSHAKGALLFLIVCVRPMGDAFAQERAPAQDRRASSSQPYRTAREKTDTPRKASVSRSLTLAEGLAILGAALDSRHHRADYSADCSHFVHGLYERAGFPYEYASSSDLYAGVDEFRRVATPQPGDLAVWPGHAGIVVNPAQHSFFSALRSGPGVDSYDSAYWRQRGRPRFFRYIKPAGGVSSSIRNATWKPTASGMAQTHEPVVEDPTLAEEDASASGTSASGKLHENEPVNSDLPLVVLVNSGRPKPNEVAAAFLESSNNSEQRLGGSDLFKPDQSLIVFDHFEVRKVHIAGEQSWVDVQIDEPASLTGGKADVHRRSVKQRWPLTRRDRKSWELSPPSNTIYLPRQVAARLLAHELALLTEDRPDAASRAPEKAGLAKLLNVLLEQ